MEENKQEEVKKDEGPPPSLEDMAAHDFMTLVPKFIEAMEPLSLRQLKRVVGGLMEFPMGDGLPDFEDNQEKFLFNIGMQLHDVKFVIMKAVLEMKKEQIDQLMKEKMNEGVQDSVHGQGSGEVQTESVATSSVGTG